jgi:hypothetical protein
MRPALAPLSHARSLGLRERCRRVRGPRRRHAEARQIFRIEEAFPRNHSHASHRESIDLFLIPFERRAQPQRFRRRPLQPGQLQILLIFHGRVFVALLLIVGKRFMH